MGASNLERVGAGIPEEVGTTNTGHGILDTHPPGRYPTLLTSSGGH